MNRMPLLAAILACLSATATATPADNGGLATISEHSGFVRTGRYDEVIRLCETFARAYPAAVRCESFGTTPEGRPMQVLVVSKTGAFTPEAARARGLPVTLIQGGIHAGEIDGKDAGFLALRENLEGKAGKGALERQVLLFVPVFNVDGHERFARWNRPNQRGPEEMGWRTTAQNYNLNRDYVKADTPEMQAMLALVNRWDPLAYVDLHVTDGAKFEHDVSIQVEPVHGGDAGLSKAGTEWRDGVIAALARQGSLPLPFYPSFVENDNPASGFEDGVAPPRFSQSYIAQRNRLGMLVETHSWREYPHRVKVTRNTILAVLDLVARHGQRWQAEARAADARAAAVAGQPVALDYKATDKARTIAYRGYAYTRTPSEVSGALMTRYDETKPQIWHLPLRDEVVPSLTVAAPRAGYVVPPAHAIAVARQLDIHGVDYRRLDTALTQTPVQAFRATQSEAGKGSVEGHQRLTLLGAWGEERADIPAGALFVPIAQAKSRLVMALLEPQAPDSIAAWGGFNNAFERKEYMEDYVAEEVAREMLKDLAVKAEFDSRLKADAGFAANPAARLEFFARRHSSWDARYNLYPVLRLDQAPR
ncbi:peptidase M14 [Lysobacter daejeonensis GH1-9]|uniref:Peptidase M14 n=1 Tax=Lysobacter daejeonensis GH1-9 TaxID=1385517 RepID=A0A0A0F005_9GAMM|nr:M14 family metallopeptidase [Lysobacter daejeonensis]KGM55850.1 peptidase M14 [Lysobacter daejeonensis GH1-9]